MRSLVGWTMCASGVEAQHIILRNAYAFPACGQGYAVVPKHTLLIYWTKHDAAQFIPDPYDRADVFLKS